MSENDPLMEKAAAWEPSEKAVFVTSDGHEIPFPVAVLREYGTGALPPVPGLVKHKRARFKWAGRAVVAADPRTEYATAGFAAARDMAELLAAQQTAQVQQAAALSDALTQLISGVAESIGMLIQAGGEIAATRMSEGADDKKFELAANALGMVLGRGSEGGDSSEADWERLARIADELGAEDIAIALRDHKPGDLVEWVQANRGPVTAAITANMANFQKLKMADKKWLGALRDKLDKLD